MVFTDDTFFGIVSVPHRDIFFTAIATDFVGKLESDNENSKFTVFALPLELITAMIVVDRTMLFWIEIGGCVERELWFWHVSTVGDYVANCKNKAPLYIVLELVKVRQSLKSEKIDLLLILPFQVMSRS